MTGFGLYDGGLGRDLSNLSLSMSLPNPNALRAGNQVLCPHVIFASTRMLTSCIPFRNRQASRDLWIVICDMCRLSKSLEV